MPRILPPTDHSITLAVDALRRGEIVAVPTETVYGLAADAMSEPAVRRVFAMKGRPANNPLIVHVLGVPQARELAAAWDERCDQLASTYWPGALTLVVPKAPSVPDVVTAGHATVALRAPAHPVMRELLAAFGGPLAAPSANRSAHVSPTTAAHVAAEFPGADDMIILDGGPCAIGIESTVLDMTTSPPRVLRPGGVTVEQLRETLGDVEFSLAREQARSPGTSPRHYAPRTPSELLDHDELQRRAAGAGERFAAICIAPTYVRGAEPVIVLPRDPAKYAAMLYDALRRADEAGVERILIERPVDRTGLWSAIQDRLLRATAAR